MRRSSTKLGRKPEENYPTGTDLMYQIGPVTARVIAVPFSVTLFFRERGGKRATFSKNRLTWPQKAPPGVSCFAGRAVPRAREAGGDRQTLPQEKGPVLARGFAGAPGAALSPPRRQHLARKRGKRSLAPSYFPTERELLWDKNNSFQILLVTFYFLWRKK